MLKLARSRKSLISKIADTVALELKLLLPWMCSVQELVGLAFRWNNSVTRGSYELKWLKKIAKIMKSPLGFLATQEGPLAVVLFLEVIVPSSTTKSFLILVPK